MLEGVRAFARSKAGCGALARWETLRHRTAKKRRAAKQRSPSSCNAPKKFGSGRRLTTAATAVRGGGRGVRGQASAPAAAYARMPPRRQSAVQKKRFFWKGAKG